MGNYISYAHIDNLYRNQEILMFKECYAMEKIHGTSSHICFKPKLDTIEYTINFFAGGEKHEKFVALFDQSTLLSKLSTAFNLGPTITIYGEAYGGSQQGMSYLYGKNLKFIAFDVKIGETWLSVPCAEQAVKQLGLEFVSYVKIPTTIEAIDAERDKDSIQAVLNGVDLTQLPKDKTAIREGVVLRPLIELTKNNGERIVAKHKSDKFNERATKQKVDDPEKLAIITEATKIADEWVTVNRLKNILSHLKEEEIVIENIPLIIRLMIEDILREASDEIVENKDTRKAISGKTVQLFKEYLQNRLHKEG